MVELSGLPEQSGFLSDAWNRFRRQPPAMLGLGLLALIALAAVAVPLVMPYDPLKMRLSEAFVAPNSVHVLGTDQMGRDLLTRLLYGGRLSLVIGFLAVGLGLVVGLPFGAISGYYGGWVDMVIQRVTDLLLSFPSVLIALSLVAVLGVGLENVILSVGISMVPVFVRIVRSSVLSIRTMTYVEAARAAGVRDRDIIRRHVLANSLAPVIIQATLGLGSTVLTAAGLGFLGLGVQAPTPEWGTMLGEGRQYIFSASYLATVPGVAIFLTVLSFNLLGDGLRDALDPRLRSV